MKEERHRVSLIKGRDLVFFAPAGADFDNPAPLERALLDAALTTAREWAGHNNCISEPNEIISEDGKLPESPITRFLEITVPPTFVDSEHTIFDALDMGAAVGKAYEVSREELASHVTHLVKATADLVQAVEYTPLGTRGIKAVEAAKSVLGEFPASNYQRVPDVDPKRSGTGGDQLPKARIFVGEWDHTWSWNEDGRMEVKCRVLVDVANNMLVAAQVRGYESWRDANSDEKGDLAKALFVENNVHTDPHAFDFVEIDRFPTWAAGAAGEPQLPPYKDDDSLIRRRREHGVGAGKLPVKPMTHGDANAVMVLVGERMGLNPALVAEATRQLEGGAVHPMTGAAIEKEAVALNNRLRVDSAQIERANAHAEDLKVQYGFAQWKQLENDQEAQSDQEFSARLGNIRLANASLRSALAEIAACLDGLGQEISFRTIDGDNVDFVTRARYIAEVALGRRKAFPDIEVVKEWVKRNHQIDMDFQPSKRGEWVERYMEAHSKAPVAVALSPSM
ncbi:hypothetical protein [Burkholderia sp. MBR-1]|uniref:hypothetical protein n=1 Tax=Burkholderia sp. MBR-1 TaxID=2732364 RepID=UPI0015EF969C|nr:hypothetical protein [Burkholderia sp. MBR-1]